MKLPIFLRRLKKFKLFVIRRVVGKSMVPTLYPGQYVIATNLFNKPVINDVVVIRHNQVDKIKRIKNIQNQKLFLIGDNSRQSVDSRSFGWLSINSVVGRVIWPKV